MVKRYNVTKLKKSNQSICKFETINNIGGRLRSWDWNQQIIFDCIWWLSTRAVFTRAPLNSFSAPGVLGAVSHAEPHQLVMEMRASALLLLCCLSPKAINLSTLTLYKYVYIYIVCAHDVRQSTIPTKPTCVLWDTCIHNARAESVDVGL